MIERSTLGSYAPNRRPWGSFEDLAKMTGFLVKRISVLPAKRLSLQRHRHRAEHWYVIEGEGVAVVEKGEHLLVPGASLDIPCGALHRIANTGVGPLVIIEIQTGDHLSEDDVERYEDDYGRVCAKTIDVVVPVFNEARTLPEFLRRIDALHLPLRIICVDNGSRDGTVNLLKSQTDITLIRHDTNLGYGRSLIDGLSHATAEIVIILDADCEYPPETIPSMLKCLETVPVVYGSRFLPNADADIPRKFRWGNRSLTWLFNVVYRRSLTDLYTGMKGFRREVIQDLRLRRSGFEHVVELTARLVRNNIEIAETPVAYRRRKTGKSKMRHLKEGLKALACLMYYRIW